MGQKRLHKGLSFLVLISLFSCGNKEGFDEQKAISKEGLTPKAIVFEVPAQELNNSPQNIFIWLRNNPEYEFSNIFLIATLKVNNEIYIQDTLEYAMTAPDGSWLGKDLQNLKKTNCGGKKVL